MRAMGSRRCDPTLRIQQCILSVFNPTRSGGGPPKNSFKNACSSSITASRRGRGCRGWLRELTVKVASGSARWAVMDEVTRRRTDPPSDGCDCPGARTATAAQKEIPNRRAAVSSSVSSGRKAKTATKRRSLSGVVMSSFSLSVLFFLLRAVSEESAVRVMRFNRHGRDFQSSGCPNQQQRVARVKIDDNGKFARRGTQMGFIKRR